jgi:hypothetical protein
VVGAWLGFNYVGGLKHKLSERDDLIFGFLLAGFLAYVWVLLNALISGYYYGSADVVSAASLLCGGLNNNCAYFVVSSSGSFILILLVAAGLIALASIFKLKNKGKLWPALNVLASVVLFIVYSTIFLRVAGVSNNDGVFSNILLILFYSLIIFFYSVLPVALVFIGSVMWIVKK